MTADRYAAAEALMNPISLLRDRTIKPRWIDASDRFRYVRTTEDGATETVEVDPATGEKTLVEDVPVPAAVPRPHRARFVPRTGRARYRCAITTCG